MTSIKRTLGVLAFGAMFSVSQFADAAGPTPADLATARELYTLGMNALDAGKAQAAAEKLSAAWTLAPTPLIGVALAQAQDKLAKLIEARETVLAVRRLEVAPNETARSSQARAEAEKLDEALARRIPHVHVSVTNVREGLTVTIDGGSGVPLASLAVDRPMDPGEHSIELVAGGRSLAKATVTLGESERKEITLTTPDEPTPLAPAITTTVTTPATTSPHETEPRPLDMATEAPTSSSPLAWIGGVTMGAGLVTGVIFGALALNEASIVKTNCVSSVCYPPYDGDLNAANAYSAVSTVAFVVAGVGAVVFVVGLVINHSHQARAHVSANGATFSF